MVDGLLEALGLVALWDQGAGGAGGGALLDPGGLGQGLIVGLDLVDHDPPLAVDVDGPLGLDVGGLGGAEVGLLHDLLQAGHAVVSVGQDVLVHLLDRVVVVLDSLLDLVGGVLLILKAPGLGVTLGALGRGVVGLLGRVVGSWVVGFVVWFGMIWSMMVMVLMNWKMFYWMSPVGIWQRLDGFPWHVRFMVGICMMGCWMVW